MGNYETNVVLWSQDDGWTNSGDHSRSTSLLHRSLHVHSTQVGLKPWIHFFRQLAKFAKIQPLQVPVQAANQPGKVGEAELRRCDSWSRSRKHDDEPDGVDQHAAAHDQLGPLHHKLCPNPVSGLAKSDDPSSALQPSILCTHEWTQPRCAAPSKLHLHLLPLCWFSTRSNPPGPGPKLGPVSQRRRSTSGRSSEADDDGFKTSKSFDNFPPQSQSYVSTAWGISKSSNSVSREHVEVTTSWRKCQVSTNPWRSAAASKKPRSWGRIRGGKTRDNISPSHTSADQLPAPSHQSLVTVQLSSTSSSQAVTTSSLK